MCGHKPPSIFKHPIVTLTTLLEVVFLLATDNYAHVGSISPTTFTSSLRFKWLNESTLNESLYINATTLQI